MISKLELNIPELITELRAEPVISRQGVWDPHQTTLCGETYIRIDDSCVLCSLGVLVFQPFTSRIIRENYVTIQFLQMSGNYYHHHGGEIQHVKAGSVSLTSAQESMTEIRELRPNSSTEPTRAISIHIAREHLIQSFGLKPDLWQEEHRDAFFNRDKKSFSMANPLTPEMWLALDAVIDCKLEGTIRNLYLKAKAHELIILTAMLFNDINRPGHSSALASDERDRRLISIAAHIYRRELHNPPSIEELSRRIGMNRNKLTLGFRTLYGSTPAEYSRNIRLRWAERRLIEGIAINQVSLEAGYDSISAFSRAFKSRYGYSPSEVITGSMQADFNNYS